MPKLVAAVKCSSAAFRSIIRPPGSAIVLERLGKMSQHKRRASTSRAVSPPPLKRQSTSSAPSKSMTQSDSDPHCQPHKAANPAVANFFTPTSQKPPKRVSWATIHETLLVARHVAAPVHTDPAGKIKIAAFDLDSTLIVPKSGKKFAKDATDWKWWHSCVPQRLKELHNDGFRVVVISNQAGLSLRKNSKTAKSDQKRVSDFKQRVEAILDSLDLPITVYAATEHDGYRKPRTGTWREVLEDLDVDKPELVDCQGSMFVGDAGGRLKDDGLGGDDFSTSDRDFAANIGIVYHTPEEFFLQEKPREFSRPFEPTRFLCGAAENTGPKFQFDKVADVELVLFCGSPGSGKSTLYWRHFEGLGYARVNQDKLGTRQKCLAKAAELLEARQSVVVDNTNADAETRKQWVSLASKYVGVVARCVRLTTDARVCEHNNAVRAFNASLNPEQREMLPRVAFTGFKARLQEPRVEEGFHDIVEVEFSWEGTERERRIWEKFWS